ncbi:hypothetical protein DQ240_07980 [Blastococcus sp. TF02A-26]|nr:hypothetical protein DQ240_07980 [Blastococcus sp. TF02A-26]
MTREDRAWLYALFGGGGLALLLAAPWLAGWLDAVPFIPFSGVLDWLASLDSAAWWVLRPAIGLVAGVGLAAFVIADEYQLEVGDDAVVVVRGRDRRRVSREQVVGVYRERKKVVIHGTGGRVLFDQQVEAPKDAVRAAFADRGYPWESE